MKFTSIITFFILNLIVSIITPIACIFYYVSQEAYYVSYAFNIISLVFTNVFCMILIYITNFLYFQGNDEVRLTFDKYIAIYFCMGIISLLASMIEPILFYHNLNDGSIVLSVIVSFINISLTIIYRTYILEYRDILKEKNEYTMIL